MKSWAAVMAAVLVLQAGCDLWCQYAQEIESAQLQGEATPPCHTAEESTPSDTSPQPRDHGAPKDCIHPEAADDNSKFQSKIVKASQPVSIIEVPGLPIVSRNDSPRIPDALTKGVDRASPPLSVLRI